MIFDYSTRRTIRKVLLYLLIVAALVAFTLEGSVGIFPYGAIITLSVTGFFGLIAGLLHGKWIFPQLLKTSKVILSFGLIVSILSFAAYKVQINHNFEKSNKLLKSIIKYKRKTGDYPRNLQLLIPDYISKIPVVTTGIQPRTYRYNYLILSEDKTVNLQKNNKTRRSGFFIEYDGYLGVTYSYQSIDGKWKLMD
jgi:hypothetical protein